MAFASFSMYEALVKLQWTQTQSTLFGAHRSGSDRNDWVDHTLELGIRRGGGLSRSPAVVGNLAQRRLNPNPSLLPGPGKTRPRGRPPYVPAAPAPSPSVGACVDLIEVPAGHPVQQARGVSQFCGPLPAKLPAPPPVIPWRYGSVSATRTGACRGQFCPDRHRDHSIGAGSFFVAGPSSWKWI